MSEMIERVAKAIKATELDCASWGDEVLAELAVAVIRAMREPTEAMLLAGGTEMLSPSGWVEKDAFRDVWQKAIDAALADAEGGDHAPST